MFIIIKYYDNQQKFININCPVKIVLDYMQTFFPDLKKHNVMGELDVCDTKGEVQNLSLQPYMKYTYEILKARETYIPVYVERTADNIVKHVQPLLFNVTTLYPEFEHVSPLASKRESVHKVKVDEAETKGKEKKSSVASKKK